jgi:hypothetical protein
LAAGAKHAVHHIAAELALGHRLDQVTREAVAEQGFKLDLERFTLQLLRALLGLPAQFLDLALHAGDLGLLFRDLGLQRVLSLEPCLVANGTEVLLDLLLHHEVHLTLGFLKLAFLAQHLGLDPLGFGKLRVVGGEHLLQFRTLRNAIGDLRAMVASHDVQAAP